MLNFSDQQTNVGNLLERTDTGMRTKIKAFLNEALRFIVGQRPWMALLRTITFTGVVNLDYFITDQNVEQVIDISQHATPVVLALTRYNNLLQRRIDILTTPGNPTCASPAGEVGIKAAMPADGTITFVSTSASDTTPICQIRGYNANLIPITEELTCNGTSTVTSANTYSSKEGYEPKFSKSADTVGVITFTRGAVAIADLAPLAREARYKKWKVWPVFSSNLTMYATVKMRQPQMVNNEDVPSLECDNALVLFAYARCLMEKRQLSKAAEVMGKKDIDGTFTPGTFGSELEALVAKEPQFGENFQDQFVPQIQREGIDTPGGTGGYQLWPATGT